MPPVCGVLLWWQLATSQGLVRGGISITKLQTSWGWHETTPQKPSSWAPLLRSLTPDGEECCAWLDSTKRGWTARKPTCCFVERGMGCKVAPGQKPLHWPTRLAVRSGQAGLCQPPLYLRLFHQAGRLASTGETGNTEL